MNVMQEAIRFSRPQTLEQQAFHGPVEHGISYQDVFRGLITCPPGCPPSRILQIVEDIVSPIVWLKQAHLGVFVIRARFVSRVHLSKIIGFGILSSMDPVEIDIPQL